MKPFNLEEALSGKAVMLRNGDKAFVRHHETEPDVNPDYKLLGYDADGGQLSWRESGSYLSEGITAESDIIGMYPETRIINGFEVPAPETAPLNEGDKYYLANPLARTFCSSERWLNSAADRRWLERGLVFLSEECAITNTEAMLGIDPYEGDE